MSDQVATWVAFVWMVMSFVAGWFIGAAHELKRSIRKLEQLRKEPREPLHGGKGSPGRLAPIVEKF